MSKLKVKLLTPAAKMPTRARKGDAGLDLYISDVQFLEFDQVRLYFGVAVEIPEGFVGFVCPRSSIVNTAHRLANSVGVIDSGYRGEITAVTDVKPKDYTQTAYKVGDRGMQLVIVPYAELEPEQVEKLSESERGSGGYGSTGV